MMGYPRRREVPLTNARRVLVGVGAAMLLAQVIAAFAAAPATTGEGDANLLVLFGMWCVSVAWSTAAVLCLIRQADVPDIMTASMLVTITAYAAFAFSAAYDVRGTEAEYSLVDAIFFGVTSGALVGVLVWGISLGIARALRLQTSEAE